MGWFENLPEHRQTQLRSLLGDPRGQRTKDHAGGDVGFGCWLLVADALCSRRAALSIFDLADMNWRDWYDDELEPREAVARALQAEGAEP